MRLVLSLLLFLISSSTFANTHDGLLGWWSFDETSGNAVDSSTQGNTATNTATTIIANCHRSNCRSFNGTSAYLDTGADNLFDFNTTTFTVAGWLKTIATANTYIFGKMGASITGGWGVGVNNGTANKFSVITKQAGTSNNGAVRDSSSSVNDGLWHHFVAVITTDAVTVGNNTITIYIDGLVNQGSLTQSAASDGTSVSNLIIGGRLPTVQNFFSGQLDDMRVYNRGLTAQESYDLYILGSKTKGYKVNQ